MVILAPTLLEGELPDPLPDLRVHVRVVQEAHVMSAAEVVAILELEWNPPAPAAPGSARVLHEQVPEQPAEPVGSLGEGRADEVVGGVRQEWDLAAAVAQELVGVAIAPVLLHAVAEPHVLDADAAPVEEEVREGPRFRQSTEGPAGDVCRPLQWRSEVRRPQAEDVPQAVRPVVVRFVRVMAGATC